ncbi:MAG: PQQ-binding-like beta-propeller repeat protein [Pirellulaceae bacterium]
MNRTFLPTFVLFGVCLVAGLLSPLDCVAQWPRFLGPDANGISNETGLIQQLSPETVKTLWRVPGGVGMSAVALSGDRAITLWNTDTEQVLAALDAQSGKTLWTTPVSAAYENGQGDGPRATPTIDDDRVYAFTSDGILAAVELKSGDKVWSTDTMALLETKPAEYGLASSPLVTDKHVVVHVGANQGSVAAFHKSDGKLAWTAGSGAAGYSSPTLLTVAGEKQIVSFVGAGVLGIEPATGKTLWSYDFPTPYDCNTASPIEVYGNVFISAGENHGCVMLSISKNGVAYRANEKWASVDTKSVLRNEWQTSIVLNGYLYGFDNVGSAGPTTHLTCVNAESGEVAWQKTRFGKGNLVLADGNLWITTMSGELVLVKATADSYQELGRIKLLGKTRQSLSISDSRGYLRDDAQVVCIDLKASK